MPCTVVALRLILPSRVLSGAPDPGNLLRRWIMPASSAYCWYLFLGREVGSSTWLLCAGLVRAAHACDWPTVAPSLVVMGSAAAARQPTPSASMRSRSIAVDVRHPRCLRWPAVPCSGRGSAILRVLACMVAADGARIVAIPCAGFTGAGRSRTACSAPSGLTLAWSLSSPDSSLVRVCPSTHDTREEHRDLGAWK